MDVRQLKYYKTIVDEGSISKAAQTLHMAQPPLSKQLKQIEMELGVTLINRGQKNWELTEAGHLLYQHATDILNRIVDMKHEFSELKKGLRGTLSVGVSSSCLSYLIKGIKHFNKNHPNVHFKIWEESSYSLQELLLERKIDLAFMLRPLNVQDYGILPFPAESFVVIIPKSWKPHFSNNLIELKDLVKFPFLLLGQMKDYSVYEDILNQFYKHNLSLNVVLEARDISTLISLVASEIGISIIPKTNIHIENSNGIEVLDIKDYSLHIEPAVIWMKHQYQTELAKQFLGNIKSIFGQRETTI